MAGGPGADLLKNAASPLRFLKRRLGSQVKRQCSLDMGNVRTRRCTEGLAGVGKTANPLSRPKVQPEVTLDPLVQGIPETCCADTSSTAGSLVRDLSRFTLHVAASAPRWISLPLNPRGRLGFGRWLRFWDPISLRLRLEPWLRLQRFQGRCSNHERLEKWSENIE